MQAFVTVLALFSALVSVAVGIIVIRGEQSNKYRQSFVLLSILVALWIISNVVFPLVQGDFRYAVALASYGIAMLLAVQLMIFCLCFVGRRTSPRFRVFLSVAGLAAAALSTIPGFIAYGVEGVAIQTNLVPLVLYGCALLGCLIGACVVLLTARQKAPRQQRQIIDVILVGLAASAAIGVLSNLILPLMNIYEVTQLGPASAVIFIGAVAYAIVRHGLFDVRLAVVRSVTYFMVLLVMVGMYLAFAWLLSEILRSSFVDINPADVVLNVGIALVLAVVLQPTKRFFDRLTSRIFYRDNYDNDDFYARLSSELSVTTDLRNLLKRAADEIGSTLKAEQAFFFVRYGDDRYMNAGTMDHKRIPQDEIDHIDQFVRTNGESDSAFVVGMSPGESMTRKLLTRHKIAVVLPLVRGDTIVGYLFLGNQRSRDYSQRDLRVLDTVSDELVIAIQNALSVQEVKELNATLQQRIDEATSELRRSNAALQKLDATKDEFVSMASHQLRTPLTSVKGYISMVIEGDAGKITPTQKKLLTEAFTSSERMVHLINDFLNVSRLQTGKFIIDRRRVDLAKLVGQEVESLETTASAHGLKLRYRQPPYFPTLYIDEGKIRQVVMNFIDNGIYYSREHTTIIVSLRVEDGNVVLAVKDTGIGVPAEEQSKLFSKFFRATNARRQRPDGTGVGMFLAKKVITSHGGSMVFESVEGEGSTFGFRLPIKRLSHAPADDADELKQ